MKKADYEKIVYGTLHESNCREITENIRKKILLMGINHNNTSLNRSKKVQDNTSINLSKVKVEEEDDYKSKPSEEDIQEQKKTPGDIKYLVMTTVSICKNKLFKEFKHFILSNIKKLDNIKEDYAGLHVIKGIVQKKIFESFAKIIEVQEEKEQDRVNKLLCSELISNKLIHFRCKNLQVAFNKILDAIRKSKSKSQFMVKILQGIIKSKYWVVFKQNIMCLQHKNSSEILKILVKLKYIKMQKEKYKAFKKLQNYANSFKMMEGMKAESDVNLRKAKGVYLITETLKNKLIGELKILDIIPEQTTNKNWSKSCEFLSICLNNSMLAHIRSHFQHLKNNLMMIKGDHPAGKQLYTLLLQIIKKHGMAFTSQLKIYNSILLNAEQVADIKLKTKNNILRNSCFVKWVQMFRTESQNKKNIKNVLCSLSIMLSKKIKSDIFAYGFRKLKSKAENAIYLSKKAYAFIGICQKLFKEKKKLALALSKWRSMKERRVAAMIKQLSGRIKLKTNF